MSKTPSRDPAIPHPGMRFYQGCWRTPEAIARKAATRTDNARRVFWGEFYMGMLGSSRNAAVFNAWAAEQLLNLKTRQAAERKEYNALSLEEKLAQDATDPLFRALGGVS